MKAKLKALLDLVELKQGWGSKFIKKQRFIIASILSFIAYYMFKNMDKMGVEKIDWLANHVTELEPAILTSIAIVYGLFTFYVSILAASAVASLVPAWNNKN